VNRLALTAGAIAIVAVSAGVAYRVQRQAEEPAVAPMPGVELIGTSRPEFTLPDVQGLPRSVSEWDGRVVALNFWATWCPPCRKEIPEFVELQNRYGERGLQFVGIALQRPEEVRGFMDEYRMNYPVLAGEMEVIRLAERYGNRIGALPYTVIIDRHGRIAYVKPGPLSGAAAEEVITPLL
jgi:peroxiredoxin